jgi:uncharacterized protein YbjT (DUF2867 family)
MVATHDIGKLGAQLLVEGRPSKNTVVDLAGPPVTFREIAATLTKILGKEIRVQEAPTAAIVPTFTSMGLTADMAALYQEMIEGITTGRVKWGPSDRRVVGTTSPETVLRGMLGRGE